MTRTVQTATALLLGSIAWAPEAFAAGPSPFEYNLDAFRKTDPAMITHREEKPLALPAGGGWRAIAATHDGRLFAAGSSAVIRVSMADGSTAERAALHQPATALCALPDGSLIAAHSDGASILPPDGTVKPLVADLGDTSRLTSVAVVSNRVYLADSGERLLWVFDLSGMPLGTVGRRDRAKGRIGFIVPSPHFDVLPDGEGGVWAVNPGRHLVERFNAAGDLVGQWGETSMQPTGFCGCCNPTDIARLPGGGFVTAEKGLVRVKWYDEQGRFKGVVAGPERFDPDTTGLDTAVAPDGRIFVLDPKRNQIRVFAAAPPAAGGVP